MLWIFYIYLSCILFKQPKPSLVQSSILLCQNFYIDLQISIKSSVDFDYCQTVAFLGVTTTSRLRLPIPRRLTDAQHP